MAGFSKKGILFRIFHAISKYIYRSADQLAVSSKGFIDYMYQQFDIPPSSIHYIPKYSDATFKTLQPNIKSIQSQEKQSLHFLFAGNIGIAQSIPTILRSAKLMEDDGTFRSVQIDFSVIRSAKAVFFRRLLNQAHIPSRYDVAVRYAVIAFL